MKKVLIFTSFAGISRVKLTKEENDLIFFLLIKHKSLLRIEGQCLVETENLDEGDIFIIADNYPEEKYLKLISSFPLEDLYILKHKSPTYSLVTNNIRIGMHENEPVGYFYPKVISILEDQSLCIKSESIIKYLFKPKIEVALDFLHANLGKMPKYFEIKNLLGYFSSTDIKTLNEIIREFPNNEIDLSEPNFMSYIRTFQKMRNELYYMAIK